MGKTKGGKEKEKLNKESNKELKEKNEMCPCNQRYFPSSSPCPALPLFSDGPSTAFSRLPNYSLFIVMESSDPGAISKLTPFFCFQKVLDSLLT